MQANLFFCLVFIVVISASISCGDDDTDAPLQNVSRSTIDTIVNRPALILTSSGQRNDPRLSLYLSLEDHPKYGNLLAYDTARLYNHLKREAYQPHIYHLGTPKGYLSQLENLTGPLKVMVSGKIKELVPGDLSYNIPNVSAFEIKSITNLSCESSLELVAVPDSLFNTVWTLNYIERTSRLVTYPSCEFSEITISFLNSFSGPSVYKPGFEGGFAIELNTGVASIYSHFYQPIGFDTLSFNSYYDTGNSNFVSEKNYYITKNMEMVDDAVRNMISGLATYTITPDELVLVNLDNGYSAHFTIK